MIWSKIKAFRLFFLMFMVVFLVGCSVRLTMNGASIPEELRFFSVQYFMNRAPLINPGLSQAFTEGLKDRISKESRLILKTGVGDCDFSGDITGYDLRAMAIQANAVSAQTRLTITIKVRYKNFKNPKQNWELSFSGFKDYSATQSINEVENELVRLIVEQITEDVFNKAFSEW